MPGASGAQRCGLCGKEYAKRARLEEHVRTHTGERPFVCSEPGCGASYMRASHLAAHTRTHRDPAEKRFPCTHCDKTFWTAQHLHRHELSCHTPGAAMGVSATELANSSTSGLSRCDVRGCGKLFAKRKHLRHHMKEAHAREDGLVYECDVPGCERRFPSVSKLHQHAKTHDAQRYACPLAHSGSPAPGAKLLSSDPGGPWAFRTWTELQQHMREVHPPRCSVCQRTFASRENLRKHVRIHEPKTDVAFECVWNGCGRSFSSKYALDTHVGRVHRGERPFVCVVCGRSFGYRHVLEKHMAQSHTEKPAAAAMQAPQAAELPHVRELVGSKRTVARVLQCPWGSALGDADDPCPQRFGRLYDLRRHLASAHALALTDDELRELLPAEQVEQLSRKRKAVH